MTTTIRARFTRKPCSLDEVLHNTDPSAPPEPIAIELRKELTAAEYDAFASTLLEDREWLTGCGGHANGQRQVVEVSAPGRTTLYVDPSGGSYGRYVGVAIDSPTSGNDQANAIRWLLDNRRLVGHQCNGVPKRGDNRCRNGKACQKHPREQAGERLGVGWRVCSV